jgi:helicase
MTSHKHLLSFINNNDNNNDTLKITEEPIEEKLPSLVFQTEVSITQVPIYKQVKDKLSRKFTYFFPNQVEFVSSFFQIPISADKIESKIERRTIEQEDNKVVLKQHDNYLITTSTSSGKTIIAILYMSKLIQAATSGTAVYVVPLKALGNEKFDEFSELFKDICNVHLVMGNEEKYTENKRSKNILITTNEKFDQLLRDEKNMKNLICVVFDELHLLNSNRGMAIEYCVAKIKTLKIPRMGLSATILNAEDIADWLEAGLIVSTFRPVPIKYGLLSDDLLFFDSFGYIKDATPICGEYSKINSGNGAVVTFLLQHIKDKISTIYFRQSRPNAVSIVKKITQYYKKLKTKPNDLVLPEIKGGNSGTDAILQEGIKYGVAFHHAGLSTKNRQFVEDMFRSRKIHVIIATPTLSIGVNLPAKWVIVDFKAFRDNCYGDIPVSEVKQMMGRAARPQYDREGYAMLCAEKTTDLTELYDKYIKGDCEPIESQFKGFNDLQMSLLGFISYTETTTFSQVMTLYKNTLIYHLSSEFRQNVEQDVNDVFDYFSGVSPPISKVNDDGSWSPTSFGKMVSSLYIHPSVAIDMCEYIRNDEYSKDPFAIVYFLYSRGGLRPLRKLKDDEVILRSAIENIESKNIELYGVSDDNYDENALKTASILIGDEYHNGMTWCDTDTDEDNFLETYKLSSGDMHQLIGTGGNLDWILYSFQRIAYYHGNRKFVNTIKDIAIRLKYGISKELVPLCRVKYVGKYYGNLLYKNGYTTPSKLTADELENIANIETEGGRKIGLKIAEKIIANVPIEQNEE